MQSLFIVGSGRSGAGVVAGLLARSGLFQGAELRAVSAPAGLGGFEAASVVEINEAMLGSVVPPEELLFDGQRWLACLNEEVEVPSCREIDDSIRDLVQRPFCLKDPRFVWTLPRWRQHTTAARSICVFRSPAATAVSLVEACRESGSLAEVGVDLERAFEIWTAVHRRILRQLRATGDWLFLHLDQVFSEEGLDSLEAFAGAELNRDFVVPQLRREEPVASVPQEALELYAELCELAGYRPTPCAQRHDSNAAEIAVVVPVRDHERSRVPELVGELSAQRGVRCDIVLVDQTTEGDLEPGGLHDPCDVRVVREPSPSRGAAYRAALGATDAAWVAWQDPAASAFPHRLARQLSFLRARPEVDLATSDLVLREADGTQGRRVAVDLSGDAPPAFWQSGVVVRREALAELDTTCFVPMELALYRDLRRAGRVAHLTEALLSVAGEAFDQREPWARQDGELLQLAQTPHLPDPQVTVLMACHNRKDALMECLEGFSRQLVAPGSLEIIVIDDGSTDGTAELVRDLRLPVPLRFLEQENGGAGSARNRGLSHVRGQVVLFVNDDTIPFPDTVQRHLEAHRELADRRAVVLGTFEQPAEECAKNLTRLLEHSNYGFAYCEFERERDLAGSYFYTCNVSVPTGAVRDLGGFDEAFPCYAEDTDYGVRLERLGYRIHFRPEARALHRHELNFDTIRWRQRAVAKAHVRLFAKHPRLLHEKWEGLTVPRLEATRARSAPIVPRFERAAETLSRVDLGCLEELGGSYAELASELAGRLEGVFKELNGYWWTEGFLDGFRDADVSGFPEALAARPVEIADTGPFVLLMAHADERPLWLAAAEAWLTGCRGPEVVPDGATLAVVSGPGGPGPAAIRESLAGVVGRSGRTGSSRQPGAVVVVDPDLRGTQRARLFAAACAWIPSGSGRDAEDRQLAALANTPELELDARAIAIETLPWPLATLARTRVLAWPRWDSPEALRELVDALAPLVGRDDTCVVLRHDPAIDGDASRGLLGLQTAARERHGAGGRLDVLVEPSPDQAGLWPRLAQAADAVLCFADRASDRRTRLTQLGLPVLDGESALDSWLTGHGSAASKYDVPVQLTEEPVHA